MQQLTLGLTAVDWVVVSNKCIVNLSYGVVLVGNATGQQL